MNIQLSGTYPKRKNSVLIGKWGPSTDLLVHEAHRKPQETETPGFRRDSSSEIIRLKWNKTIFDSKACRELISESCHIFTLLNSIKGEGGSHPINEVIKVSRKYRSVIRSCVERLQEMQPEPDLLILCKDIERIWHLLEILFLDAHTPGLLVGQLMSWLQWHFPENDQRLEEVLSLEDPSSHPLFWKTMNGLLIRGQVREAKMLLENYDEEELKDFTAAINELLTTMPIYAPGQMSHEFVLSWQAWSNDCNAIKNTGYFNAHPHLLTLLKILCGDQETIKNVKNEETKWYHCIPAQLLYRDPFMKELELVSLAEDALKSFKRPQDITAFDRILMNAFNYDLMEVIKEGCTFSDNWYFVAHFVDLLAAGNQLSKFSIEDPLRLREFLLIDYAESLAAHSSLWSLSVEYFDACSRVGRLRLESALERVPLDSEKKAEAVLNLAIKFKFKHLYRIICRNMAQRYLSQENLASGLVWGVKGEDAHICSSIAESMLKQLVQTGSFIDADVISSLGTKMLVSDRLTFLAKYYEFREMFNRKSEEEKVIAGDLLVSLISSNISPSYFLPVLLLDVDSLLQSQDPLSQPLFDASQTYQILASFEDVLDIDQESKGDKESTDVLNEKLNQLKEREGQLRVSLERLVSKCSLQRNLLQ